ncbi:DNA adenine methylase [Trinickia dinghuensis]|uniref:site-specific DNA-methyltransferase (adenine-specific) n=1 Tax=Trinickia dinghuensis TaxID=2291023 RepID=A0A3D8K0A8_9BURK|nr:DNA adenine methylase [Trinickia dinghuensis]RDU98285.1 DNA adenine methylase [Trinickia dinghuensis]
MRYPGGKGKCYQRLINLMPPHRVYIESHLGGGAVMRHKRPADRSIGIDIDARVINDWRKQAVPHCDLVHSDAVRFLADYDYCGDELIYSDPPYVASTRRRTRVYRHEYSTEDHVRLLQTLGQVPCKVLLSGYDSELYARLLPAWRKVSFSAKTHTGMREECVWMNFEPPAYLHDATYLGRTFRERETIKRRHSRLMARFEQMDPIERNDLLRMLNDQFGFVPCTL